MSIRTLRTIVIRLPTVVSGCAAIAIIGYFVGWVSTMGYLSVFGASWLIHQFPTAHFLQKSWFPIALLGILAFTEAKSVVDDWKGYEKQGKRVLKCGIFDLVHVLIGSYLLIRVVIFVLARANYSDIQFVFLLDILFATLSVWLLVSTLHLRNFRWDYTSGIILVFAVCMTFCELPWQYGKLTGRRDLNRNFSASLTSKRWCQIFS